MDNTGVPQSSYFDASGSSGSVTFRGTPASPGRPLPQFPSQPGAPSVVFGPYGLHDTELDYLAFVNIKNGAIATGLGPTVDSNIDLCTPIEVFSGIPDSYDFNDFFFPPGQYRNSDITLSDVDQSFSAALLQNYHVEDDQDFVEHPPGTTVGLGPNLNISTLLQGIDFSIHKNVSTPQSLHQVNLSAAPQDSSEFPCFPTITAEVPIHEHYLQHEAPFPSTHLSGRCPTGSLNHLMLSPLSDMKRSDVVSAVSNTADPALHHKNDHGYEQYLRGDDNSQSPFNTHLISPLSPTDESFCFPVPNGSGSFMPPFDNSPSQPPALYTPALTHKSAASPISMSLDTPPSQNDQIPWSMDTNEAADVLPLQSRSSASGQKPGLSGQLKTPTKPKSRARPRSNTTLRFLVRHGCYWDCCEKDFGSNKDMERHVKSVHRRQKVDCGCGKSYARLDGRLRHRRKCRQDEESESV